MIKSIAIVDYCARFIYETINCGPLKKFINDIINVVSL